MTNLGCDRCNAEVVAGTICPCCAAIEFYNGSILVSNYDSTQDMVKVVKKSLTKREGDFIWINGKKRLYRKLSKDERRRAIKELKEQENDNGFKNFIKRK